MNCECGALDVSSPGLACETANINLKVKGIDGRAGEKPAQAWPYKFFEAWEL